METIDIIEKLASEGHLTNEQLEKIGKNVNEIMSAIDKNPAILKEAGLPADTGNVFMHQVLPATAGGLLGVLGLRGIDTIMSKIKKHTIEPHRKEEAYNNMLDTHPDLAERDQSKVRLHFDSLFHFSPMYATDPLMAGEYVRQNMDSGGAINLTTPKTVTEVEKAIRSQGHKPLEEYAQFPKPSSIPDRRKNQMDEYEYLKRELEAKERLEQTLQTRTTNQDLADAHALVNVFNK